MNEKRPSFLAGCILLALPWAAGAYEITAESLERHISYLAGDDLEGRDSGTPGGRKAEEYVERELLASGLDAVETQDFDFVAGARLGPGNSFAIGGKALLSGSFQPYPFSASGSGEWPAVFAGYGIEAPELGRDDYAGLDVKGKAVVVLAGSPDGENPHGKFSPYQGARAKALKALEKKAAAILIVLGEKELLPKFEGDDVTRDAGIPVAAVVREGIPGMLGIDLDGAARELDGRKTAGRDLGLPIGLRTDLIFEKRKARNVFGWLRARRPDAGSELIIVGAHLDGLGRGGSSSMRRERIGEIHNGADDNASGVAGMIELARKLRERSGDLRRTILFIAFGAEERGLIGSRRFAEKPLLRVPPKEGDGPLRPAAPPFEAAAMVNLDMIGRLRDGKLMSSGLATGDGWEEILDAAWKRARAAGAPTIVLSRDKADDLFGTSDHISLYEGMKIPVIYFFTGGHREYHTPDDDAYRTGPSGAREPLINFEGERAVLRYLEEVVMELEAREKVPAYRAGVKLAPKMGFKVVLRLMPDYGADVEGMRIAEVTTGGPAERAGLRSGDVIVRFGNTSVRSVRDYMVGLEQAKPGESVEIEYLRAGERRTVRVEPASLPKDR